MVDLQSVPKSVLKHVVDVHCHPTDSPTPSESMQNLSITICAMSTRREDQALVRELANSHPDKVIPCFGYHPWFSHWISLKEKQPIKEEHYRSLFLNSSSSEVDKAAFEKILTSLPEPLLLREILDDLNRDLADFPQALLGEVGLDRTCRVPFDYAEEKRELSPFTIPITHQLAILEAQMDIAVKLRRNISFHGVKAPKATLEVLTAMKVKHGSSWNKISIDMHSCGLSVEAWKGIQKLHSNVYISLSTAINTRSSAYRSLIAATSPERILVESDIHEIDQCAQRTWDMLCIVADIYGWNIETTWESEVPKDQYGAVRHMEENWTAFKKGGHIPAEETREIKRNDKLNRRRIGNLPSDESDTCTEPDIQVTGMLLY